MLFFLGDTFEMYEGSWRNLEEFLLNLSDQSELTHTNRNRNSKLHFLACLLELAVGGWGLFSSLHTLCLKLELTDG